MHHHNNRNNVVFKKYFRSKIDGMKKSGEVKGKKTYDSFIFMKLSQ